LGSEVVRQLHKALCRDLTPDLTILMLSDLAPRINRARRRNMEQAKQSPEDENRFEKESRAFHKRVLDAYMAIAGREPGRVVKVDARDPIEKVHRRIVEIVGQKFAIPAVTGTKR
ncbi:MAG TPA: hypothetical protein VLT16_02290, partial [Candidatus Limnocylindrales bacterium]|nr:hypothetical protein [Candidatus Limnocylindrales bacterium]